MKHIFVTILLFPIGLCLGVEPQVVAPKDYPLDKTSTTIVWEAETYSENGLSWDVIPDSLASHGCKVVVREGYGRYGGNSYYGTDYINPTIKPNPITYHVEVPRDGTYRLWMRIFAPEGCSNSCWITVKGHTDCRYYPGGPTRKLGPNRGVAWPMHMYGKWLWLEDEDIAFNLKKGEQSVSLHLREDGFEIDQLALVPTGGPAPDGVLQPTCLPRRLDSPSLQFVLKNKVISRTAPVIEGWIWLVKHNQGNLDAELTVNAEGVAQVYKVVLTDSSPYALTPFKLMPQAFKLKYQVPVTVTVKDRQSNQEVIQKLGYYRTHLDWRLTAPYPHRLAGRRGMFFRDGAETIDFSKPFSIGPATNLQWKSVNSSHFNPFGTLNIQDVLGKGTFVGTSGVAFFEVLRDGDYWLHAGGDDTLSLQVDGKTIVRDYLSRPLVEKLELYKLTLTKGVHTFSIHNTQQYGFWQFRAEIRDKDGHPSKGIIPLSIEDAQRRLKAQ